jgi:spermidine synthase
MFGLANIRPVLEFHEDDTDQGLQRTYTYYKHESVSLTTDKQDVDVLQSPYWNKMLFLDGCLQSTTKDEVIYHNALVHPLMDTLQTKDNILILGGGEGATAREVLRWSKVRSVTMVDYDEELLDFMHNDGLEWSKGAFSDRRLTIVCNDAWDFVKLGISYNAVIIDLTDPDLTNQRWSPLLRNVLEAVKASKGGFVMNAGLYQPWSTKKIKDLVAIIKDLCLVNYDFRYYIYTVFVPSFGGEWTFIVVAHKQKFMVEPEFSDVIPAWIKRGIKMLPDELLCNFDTTPSLVPIDA